MGMLRERGRWGRPDRVCSMVLSQPVSTATERKRRGVARREPTREVRDLGAVLSEHRARRSLPIQLVFLAILSGGCAWLSLRGLARASRDWWAELAFGVAFLVGAVYAIHRARVLAGLSVTVCEAGLLHRENGVVTVVLWTQLRSVLTQMISRYGAQSYTTYKYVVESDDGRKVVIGGHVERVEELGDLLGEIAVRVLLPPALRAWEAGERVAFGGLEIDREGVRAGKKRLAWADVKSVTLENGEIVWRERGKTLAWGSTMLWLLPNGAVLAEFLRAIGKLA